MVQDQEDSDQEESDQEESDLVRQILLMDILITCRAVSLVWFPLCYQGTGKELSFFPSIKYFNDIVRYISWKDEVLGFVNLL